MFSRGQGGPMDWEYENRTGPIGDSPFGELVRQSQNKDGGTAKKGGGIFSWSSNNQPSHTSYTQPQQSSPWKSSSPSKHPTWMSNNPLLNTPRRLDDNTIDSSEPDTPNTPANGRDSGLDTPETGGRDIGRRVMGQSNVATVIDSPQDDQTDGRGDATTRPASKGRRESLFSRLIWSASPGRSALAKQQDDRKINKHKRDKMKLAQQYEGRRAMVASHAGDSESEYDNRSGKKRKLKRKNGRRQGESAHRAQQQQQQPAGTADSKSAVAGAVGWTHGMGNFFTFIDSHPDLPHTLSYYCQFGWNLFLLCFFSYIIWTFWATIRADVNEKSHAAMLDALAQKNQCAQEYRKNKCEPETRLPAMESLCLDWEKCMRGDWMAVGRASVSARTFAEIFNSFIEPISYKAMAFSILICCSTVGISNFLFGFFRNKMSHAFPPHHQYPSSAPQYYPSNSFNNSQHAIQGGPMPPPPATPQRYPSGGGPGDEGMFFTPRRQASNPWEQQAPGPSGPGWNGGGGGQIMYR